MDSYYTIFLKPPLAAEDTSYKAILLQRLMTVSVTQVTASPRDNWAGLFKKQFLTKSAINNGKSVSWLYSYILYNKIRRQTLINYMLGPTITQQASNCGFVSIHLSPFYLCDQKMYCFILLCLKNIYLFICLCQVLLVACRIFHLCCSVLDH